MAAWPNARPSDAIKEVTTVAPEQPHPAPLRNRVRDLWRAGTPSISAILTIPSVPTVQVLAHAGFDSLVVDMEHGPIDLATAHCGYRLLGHLP